jgi:hypothetical protein
VSGLWIMVAGPYSSGAADPAALERNLRVLNEAALALLKAGHTPVIGVNLALPMIAAAGPESYEWIMMPLSLALAERCDACLRIGGPSRGADEEVERFRQRGRPVFFSLAEIPGVER